MKKANLFGCFWALFGAVVLTGCDKEDDLRLSEVPGAVVASFEAKFPDAGFTEWEKKGGYIVADFWQEGMETHAWYTSNGEWQMTDYDLGKNISVLPQAVYDAFMNGNYATWRVDDASKYERPSDVFYLIEIETPGQRERDLYFSPEGRLLKDEPDRENDDITPSVVF